MILAAGLGTRLGEIGRSTPKALIDVGGRTMLEHVATRLVDAGVVVNVDNDVIRAGAIERFVDEHDLGAPVSLSHEPGRPLETGGGLLHARPLFRGDDPFFLVTVDILSNADLQAMYAAHKRSLPLATLAVHARESRRALLFDENGLFGRTDARSDIRIETRVPGRNVRSCAFAAMHVVSPSIFERMTERDAFSILDPYLRLAGEGERIEAFDIGDASWLEIGTPERLEIARRSFPVD